MSSFLNRFKNLKTGSNHSHNNESDTGSICSFDEEGFLCPICHRKFADTNGLEHHYIKTHSQEQSPTIYEDTNGIKNSSKHAQIDDSLQEAAIWKQQFFVSEENRMKLSSDLMQQRQRVSDLDEELDLLHKQLRSTQLKVIEQSQEIGNLKATKDVSDAQLAMFTDELIQTQGELKEKQNQVDTLCNDLIPRPTNDDVDVLKRELISVQQNMNEMSLEKEQHIEQLHSILLEMYTTESLTQANQTADLQRENFEKQIASLEHELTNTQSDLESRTKKYEMQFLALTENLATVRGELKIAHEKLVDFEQIKREKADLQGRLTTSQDENRMFLERSLTSESRNEKLLLENGQLAKKNSDLESALQELAGEYQNLQIHTNKLTQRRWLNDQDVHECMKCNQLFTLTQRKHHCRNCGNIFCDTCSSKTAIVAAASKKPQRVCDQCFKELTS
ncbi:unnamed protein product [Rotaria sp. Silwood1]|nr:unnamed protein product [Rotaria sp. Silwood1]